MARSRRGPDLEGRMGARIRFIEQEFRRHSVVPEETNEPADLDDLPVTQHDPVQSRRIELLAAELRMLERRIGQLRRGVVITCEGCQEPIPVQRLLVALNATRCFHCQTLSERTSPRFRARTIAYV